MTPHYIDTAHALEDFTQHLASSDLIAFDTEFVAEDTYKPELCLVQVATRTEVAIIDPYTCGPLAGFWQQIIDPRKIIVVHAGREETLFCFRATGQKIQGLFDIQLAAGFLGHEYPISYGNIVNKLIGTQLDKEETRSDWRRRPLTAQQLKYAIQDVRDLPELYQQLHQDLIKAGRADWLNEETSERQDELIVTETDEQWFRMSGVQSLPRQSLAVAQALWRWRDAEGRRKNIPPRRILRDDLLVELAKRRSSDPRRIATLRGMDQRNLKPKLPIIASVIEESKNDEPPEWPRRNRGPRVQPPTMLTQFLAAALSSICRRKRIAPSIVGTSDDLKDFVGFRLAENRQRTDDVNELPSLLRGWRSEIVGRVLDDLLSGKSSLRISNPNSEAPLKVVPHE